MSSAHAEAAGRTPADKPPYHPKLVLAVAILLPGVGHLLNNQSTRAFMFAFSIASLGWISFHLTTPEHSFLGRYAGGLFIYAISILDAYRTAKLRWEIWWDRRRRAEADPAPSPPKG